MVQIRVINTVLIVPSPPTKQYQSMPCHFFIITFSSSKFPIHVFPLKAKSTFSLSDPISISPPQTPIHVFPHDSQFKISLSIPKR